MPRCGQIGNEKRTSIQSTGRFSARPVDADQSVRHFGRGCNSLMDSLCLAAEVPIEGAKHHPRVVLSAVPMEPEKVAAIVCQQNPAFTNGERQDLGVGHGSISLPCFQRRQHIMAQPAQFSDHLDRNVLVGIEPGH